MKLYRAMIDICFQTYELGRTETIKKGQIFKVKFGDFHVDIVSYDTVSFPVVNDWGCMLKSGSIDVINTFGVESENDKFLADIAKLCYEFEGLHDNRPIGCYITFDDVVYEWAGHKFIKTKHVSIKAK